MNTQKCVLQLRGEDGKVIWTNDIGERTEKQQLALIQLMDTFEDIVNLAKGGEE